MNTVFYRTVLIFACTCIGAAQVHSQVVWHVDGSVSSSGDGTSWACAKKTLQEGIDAATPNEEPPDQVWVRAGTYTPSTTSSTFQLEAGVLVFGGFDGTEDPMSFDPENDERDFVTNETILSGELGSPGIGDNVEVIVTAPIGDADFVLDGFTITGASIHGIRNVGAADGLFRNLIVKGNECMDAGEEFGAGLYIDSSAPTVEHTRFESNLITLENAGGGALAIMGSTGTLIRNCEFIGNSVAPATDSTYGGGAAYLSYASVQFRDCVFHNNSAVAGHGGAVSTDSGDIRMTACKFSGNEVIAEDGALPYWRGGACDFWGTHDVNLANCDFDGNRVHNDMDELQGLGGGMSHSGDLRMVNCIFSNNGAEEGGGIYCDIKEYFVANCTFVANSAADEGGGVHAVYSGFLAGQFTNSIFWYNRRYSESLTPLEDEATPTSIPVFATATPTAFRTNATLPTATATGPVAT